MRYTFSPFVLLRTPGGVRGRYFHHAQHFLDKPQFRSGLLLASPLFFSILEKKGFDASGISKKETFTLKKYINRFCYRPTPFGLFASVSLISWAEIQGYRDAKATLRCYVRPDMAFYHYLAGNAQFLPEAPTFEINPSLYRVLNEYRFIRSSFNSNGAHREYQLQTIAFATLLRDLINYCQTPRSRTDIIGQITLFAGCALKESTDYADFLIDAQILVGCERPAIAGPEQFTTLIERLKTGALKDRMQQLNLQIVKLALAEPNVQALAAIQTALRDLVPGNNDQKPQANLSVILKRDCANEHVSTIYQPSIRDGVYALSLLSGQDEIPAMSSFVNSYVKHFEGQCLPLMVALDPEAGIGYQQPLRAKNNPLLETLHIAEKNSGTVPHGNWTARHGVLMAAWLRDRSEQPIIRLDEDDLSNLKSHPESQQMLGMSVLFRTAHGKVIIENAGGINAPALIGRFTVADEAIRNAAIQMAKHLEALNPDVIFAELLQLSDAHTDNVNTREHIYDYEIPISSASMLSRKQQIPLSDLYICIADHKAVLFSRLHQKIVVPRLTSAYNHSLNKLPLFRFLADLPYQYGRYDLGFDLRRFFPGQAFYPRVEYRETILSLASWIITKTQLGDLHQATESTIRDAFQKLRERLRLPVRFSLAEGDQELIFDSRVFADIQFFSDCTRTETEFILREYLEQVPVRQYNAFLLPELPLSLPKPVTMDIDKFKSRRKYVPGSEWLYLKIYVPKIGADRLLLRIRPLLVKRYGHSKIVEWFFIRYEDHSSHIRLRLKVAPNDISEILCAFKAKLQGHIQQHLIREYQIDVYSRELERYAFAGIEKTERFFWASSELVMSFLQHNRKLIERYLFALCSAHVMVTAYIKDQAEQVNFALENYARFAEEFSTTSIKIELDKKYRVLSKDIEKTLAEPPPDLLCASLPVAKKFLKCLNDTNNDPGKTENKANYLASLIHMHLNRVFADESRKQEMIIYYLLYKYFHAIGARARKVKPGTTITGSWLPNVHP